jgi:hypothetical protein
MNVGDKFLTVILESTHSIIPGFISELQENDWQLFTYHELRKLSYHPFIITSQYTVVYLAV